MAPDPRRGTTHKWPDVGLMSDPIFDPFFASGVQMIASQELQEPRSASPGRLALAASSTKRATERQDETNRKTSKTPLAGKANFEVLSIQSEDDFSHISGLYNQESFCWTLPL